MPALAVVLAFSIAFVAYATTSRAAQATVGLGTASDFAVLAGTTITNTGSTIITGDIGLAPGSAVTGFGPGADSVTQVGSLHTADAVAVQAKSDLVIAYNDAAGRSPATPVGTQLGGTVLPAGVYDSAAGFFQITGALTLDAENDPDAVFIFQMASTLVTAPASSVSLINGANPCNVFWQVGSSATLDTTTSFQGTILALTSIELHTGATIISGRALARNGAVTMDNNTITRGTCATTAVATPTPTSTPTTSSTSSPTSTPTTADVAAPTPSPTGSETTSEVSAPTTPLGVPDSGDSSRHETAVGEGPLPHAGAPIGALVLIAFVLIGSGGSLHRIARSRPD